MKKVKIISFILVMLILFATYVFAAEPQITIQGDTEIKPGGTKTLTIKLTSEDVAAGMVSGKIQKSDNITSMSVTGKNSWNLTYNDVEGNEEQGVFNIYKAAGTNLEEIITIEYTVSNAEGTASITLSDIKITTIDYETKEVGNVAKSITIKNEITTPETPNEGGQNPGGNDGQNPGNNPSENPQEKTLKSIEVKSDATKLEYNIGEKFEKSGLVVKAIYSDGTSKEITDYTITNGDKLEKGQTSVTISYTENGVTKTTSQAIKVVEKTASNDKKDDGSEYKEIKEDDTKKEEKMPDTGVSSIVGIMVVVAVFGVMCLIRYNQYKGI